MATDRGTTTVHGPVSTGELMKRTSPPSLKTPSMTSRRPETTLDMEATARRSAGSCCIFICTAMVGMNMETMATGPALSCRLVPSSP